MTIALRLTHLALAYFGALLLGFLLYLALIVSPVFSGIPILFYRGIAAAAVTSPLLALLLAIVGRRAAWLDLSTIVGATALSLAFNTSFLIVFPVTFDRSVTMFLLARIEREDGLLDRAALEQVYTREYLGDMQQIDRRIQEQSLSGNIRVEQGRIHMTAQGKRLLEGGRMIGGWFGADPRFLDAAAVR